MVLMVRRLFFLPLHQLVAAAVLLQKVQGSHQDAAEEVEEEAVGLVLQDTLEVQETRLRFPLLKEVQEVLEFTLTALLMPVLVVAGQPQLVLMHQVDKVATAVPVLHLVFLAAALHMQVEEEVQLMLVVLVAAAALAGEALARLPEEPVLREQLILAGEEEEEAAVDPVAALAALAS